MLHLVLAREVQQPGHDLLAAVGLLDHHRQVFAHLGTDPPICSSRKCGVHDHDAERVVHLVGDAGGQLAHARQLLGLDQRLLRAGEFLVREGQVTDRAAELLDAVRQAHRRARPGRRRWRWPVRGRCSSRRRRSSARRRGSDLPSSPSRRDELFRRGHGHAEVERRVQPGEVEAGPALVLVPPRPRVHAGDAAPHVLADARAPPEVRAGPSSCRVPSCSPWQKSSSSSRVSMMPVSASLIACANSAGPSPTITWPVTRSSWMPATCSMPPLMGNSPPPRA